MASISGVMRCDMPQPTTHRHGTLFQSEPLLELDFDEVGPWRRDALGKATVELLHRRDLGAGYPHRLREPHPVEIGPPEIEHVERLAAGVAGSDIGQLTLEDRVGAVREQKSRHVESFARLGPLRLQGVHAAAVASSGFASLTTGAGVRLVPTASASASSAPIGSSSIVHSTWPWQSSGDSRLGLFG